MAAAWQPPPLHAEPLGAVAGLTRSPLALRMTICAEPKLMAPTLLGSQMLPFSAE